VFLVLEVHRVHRDCESKKGNTPNYRNYLRLLEWLTVKHGMRSMMISKFGFRSSYEGATLSDDSTTTFGSVIRTK